MSINTLFLSAVRRRSRSTARPDPDNGQGGSGGFRPERKSGHAGRRSRPHLKARRPRHHQDGTARVRLPKASSRGENQVLMS